MDAWNVISAILQLATIYLVGQGGITLSLAGFRLRDVNQVFLEIADQLGSLILRVRRSRPSLHCIPRLVLTCSCRYHSEKT